jgi:hypothetical protein
LDWQDARRAFSRARPKTGKRIAANIAIMDMTTSNSMSVKASLLGYFMFGFQISRVQKGEIRSQRGGARPRGGGRGKLSSESATKA